MRKIISALIPQTLKHKYRLKKYPEYKANFEKDWEWERIKTVPRYQHDSTKLLGNTLNFVDFTSFLFIYDKLFSKKNYKFNTFNPESYIIDARANIGLSIIYLKQICC